MGPNIAAKKRTSAKDDDFVLTLSDDENPPVEGEDGEEQEEDNDNDATTSGSGANKKRKRETAANAGETRSTKEKGSKNKKLEQEALANGKDNKRNKKGKKGAEPEPEPESEKEEEEEADAGEDDGALNPDFAFDFGTTANQGVVEGFDGWDIGDGNGDNKDAAKNGDKKGVDIDDIISRRQARKEAELQNKEKKAKKQGSEDEQMVDGEEEGEDGEPDGGMLVDFKDDELLATDGFGMGADGEDESGQSEEEDGSGSGDETGEDGSESDEGDDDNESASDNDSVATPIGHPDDGGPGDDSDAGSDDDAEEQEKRKAFFAPEEKTQEQSNAEMSKRSFQEFNLSRPILRGVAAVGFTNPTPIQRKTIPVALLGKDIVGSAVTGSGKTAAFVVPIIERLLFRPRKVPTSRVAILMPTRELAVQCYNVATKLATYTDITFCQLVGGFSLREQENVLKRRPDVIIATPGRFIDHMRNSASFTVDTLEILVLDEADRMLEDGFADELNEILTTIPKSRQTMLFSATMTDTVDKLIRVGLNRPVRLMVDSKKNTSGTLVQEFVRLRPGREGKRLGYLLHLCKDIYTGRVIIFFRQKREAHRIRIVFGLLGLKAAELHGSMSQEQVCCLLLLISYGHDH